MDNSIVAPLVFLAFVLSARGNVRILLEKFSKVSEIVVYKTSCKDVRIKKIKRSRKRETEMSGARMVMWLRSSILDFVVMR